MRKSFVLDTNVLLHSAESLESFEDNTVILPMQVIEELDRFKSRTDELGRNARRTIRRLDELRKEGSLGEGVPMGNGGILKIFTSVVNEDTSLDKSVIDNQILFVANSIKNKGEKVIFVTKDLNARIKADALGIETADFEKHTVNFDELYSGYREMFISKEKVDEFYTVDVLDLEDGILLPNEFILLKDETDPKHSALCRAVDERKVTHLGQGFDQAYGIRSKSKEQRMALEILLDPSVHLVTLIGPAGTGKTLLALAAGLEMADKEQKYDRVLVGRPIIPFGKDIGYLPGDKEEKLNHWMQPIFDNLTYLMQYRHSNGSGKEVHTERSIRKEVETLLANHIVELEALTYMRGRSIPRQYIIVDEAQNLTPHEIKTIISRAGEGSKVVLTGDPYQIDNPYLDPSSNGLIYAAERMKKERLHGHIALRKSERSLLAGTAARLL